ncbi:hypothetical protein ACLOJK_021231 [Asimina triloba]
MEHNNNAINRLGVGRRQDSKSRAMAVKGCLLLLLVVLLHAATILVCVRSVRGQTAAEPLNRSSFPDGFIFGAATAAYQVEGAVTEGGRSPSIWDTFTHQHPEKIFDHSTGDVAIDSYHRYKNDVEILKDLGMDAYRFSISWTRILPNGTLRGGINKEGIEYYNNLIDEVVSKGLKPFVTLFHWDVPQILEDKYGGFLSREIIEDFKDFADVCFWKFGDRVKHWITLNEPWTFSKLGYDAGMYAPGRCSSRDDQHHQGPFCTQGDSATEPYNVTHNLLLAHAAVVQLYKNKFQDYYATKRALDFMFMDPLTAGEYPQSMRDKVGERLPRFTPQESALLKGSFDFIGLNYYTAQYAKHVEQLDPATQPSYNTDSHANLTGSTWLNVYPRGLLELLVYTSFRYNNPVIYITENGVGEDDDADLPLVKALNDKMRVDFYRDHLSALLDAIRSGVDVRGYFAWSLMDNFEWIYGYTTRFGLTFVDYKNDLKRHPKLSALWFKKFLKKSQQEHFFDFEEEEEG